MNRKLLSALILTVILGAPAYSDSVSFNFVAHDLRTSSGALMNVGDLVIILASTDGVGSQFGDPTPEAFFSGDDIQIFRGVINAGAGGFEAAAPNLPLTASWNAGDPVMIYWYPGLPYGASAPGLGASYGAFRTDDVQYPSDIGWVTPAGSAAVNLCFLTKSYYPDSPNLDSAGYADHTVVPEPGTFGGVAAALGLVAMAVSRLRRK